MQCLLTSTLAFAALLVLIMDIGEMIYIKMLTAMKRPSARIIRRDLKDEISLSRHDLHIAALRITRVNDSLAIPRASANVKNKHAMLNQSHGSSAHASLLFQSTQI